MRYPIAERFFAPQGEGVHTGVPMAFIRLVGCSVGKTICEHCDTEFLQMNRHLGGGLYSPEELAAWAEPYKHVCITGGEPLDRDLAPLLSAFRETTFHIESSGTVEWVVPILPNEGRPRFNQVWLTVSPKPGYLDHMIRIANEIKVILGGLGDGEGWPTLEDAVRWSKVHNKPVYVQPRNHRSVINVDNMREAIDAVLAHPTLRLSAQLHKYIATR